MFVFDIKERSQKAFNRCFIESSYLFVNESGNNVVVFLIWSKTINRLMIQLMSESIFKLCSSFLWLDYDWLIRTERKPWLLCFLPLVKLCFRVELDQSSKLHLYKWSAWSKLNFVECEIEKQKITFLENINQSFEEKSSVPAHFLQWNYLCFNFKIRIQWNFYDSWEDLVNFWKLLTRKKCTQGAVH